MGSTDSELAAFGDIATVAGALAAILGGIAGAAGLAAFFGGGGGS